MKKLLDNNLFLRILSVLIAIGLWAFVLYTVKPTTQKVYKNINVTFKGEYVLEDENLAILKDIPLKADVEIKGPRVDVARIDSGDITVSVNVENIKKVGTYSLDYSVKVGGNNITVLSVTPSSSEITVETKKEKNIPLSVKKIGSLSNENEVLNTDLLMDSIVIKGPKSVIAKVVKAVTFVDQGRIRDGQQVEIPYILYDKDDKQISQSSSIKSSFNQAKVTCHILYKRTIDIYPVIIGKPADTFAIDSISASPKSITVVGPQKIIESLSNIETIPIDIDHLSAEKTYENVALNLPKSVSFYDETNKANTTSVTIKVGDSMTQDIPVTYLKTKNTDDQSKFEFKDVFNVSVSGTLKNIQKADIGATIDIGKLEAGEHEVPVTFVTTGPYLIINGSYTAKINILN